MTAQPMFEVEPWSVREATVDLGRLAQSESVFALANGHIGLRANLDEGEPFGLPGTYLNSFYELRPLPYAESGFGYPESGQTIVNVTNGKIIRLLVDDEPFDVRYGRLLAHERVLDLRAGVLRRRVEWSSRTSPGPDGNIWFASRDGWIGSVRVEAGDTTSPVITTPKELEVNATGPSGATVSYQVTASDDTDPNPSVVCDPPSGSTFAIGTTVVSCTAADASGNRATASFDVHVKGAAEQLVELHSAVVGVGPGASLARTVRRAQLYLAAGAPAHACRMLDSVIDEVRAQSGKKIPVEVAAGLIADATRIANVIGC
jgi:alpha,alpha-trehalose phosphorylase